LVAGATGFVGSTGKPACIDERDQRHHRHNEERNL